MDDRDAPQEIDLNQDGDETDEYTIDCPYCGQTIHEDTILCPYCDQFIIEDSPAAQRSQGWFWPVMVVLLVAVILVVWHGLAR
jgi:hypothetical protein